MCRHTFRPSFPLRKLIGNNCGLRGLKSKILLVYNLYLQVDVHVMDAIHAGIVKIKSLKHAETLRKTKIQTDVEK